MISILVPINSTVTTISSQLQVGDEGIFMPVKYDDKGEKYFVQSGSDKLVLKDISDYGLLNGVYWLFIEKNRKVVFEEGIYNNLTDFQWNSVYFVKPYTEKSEIEKYIGISSDEIYDTISDEGTLYMIFTLDDKVVYQIYGNPNNLGFDFDVGEYDKIKNISKEKSVFNVKRDGKLIIYKL